MISSEQQIDLIKKLIHFPRTIVSKGIDESIRIIKDYLPIDVVEVPSGTECWTWPIPNEWHLVSGSITHEDGTVVLDTAEHILSVAPYSIAFAGWVDFEGLQKHLVSDENRPDNFVYEYRLAYNQQLADWRFTLPHQRRQSLRHGRYYVDLNTITKPSTIKIPETTLPGKTEQVILIISHLCHPGQANDGLSGIVGQIRLYYDLLGRSSRKYTYKFIMPPETIGSIAWLWSKKEHKIDYAGGIVLEMLGANAPLVFKESHTASSLLDRIFRHILKFLNMSDVKRYKFFEGYGNDELVFADPTFDVPMVSIQRHPIKEYHTDADNIDALFPEKFDQANDLLLKAINILEADYIPLKKFEGPLYLSRYDLYVDPSENMRLHKNVRQVMQCLNGKQSLFDIAEELDICFWSLHDYMENWFNQGLTIKLDK